MDPGVGEHGIGGIRWWVDLAGVLWVLLAAVLILLPTLIHGVYLGSYDWISQYGLSQRSGVTVQHSFAGDQVTQLIPWTNLAWTQVHHGQLPLWNPYSALGTPLAFNWQSSAFSVPALVGYLVPMHLAYTVQIIVTFFVAGSGAYVMGRVFHLNVMACALAGTAFELSGSFVGWIGWPVASVMSWSGWILAAVILVSRGHHRFRSVLFLAVTLACAILAGQPDTLVLMAIFVTVFVVALVVAQSRSLGAADLGRKVIDLAAGAAAGIGLGAPLLLPGLQLASKSIRSIGGGAFNAQHALSVDLLVQQVLPGINGLPFTFRHIYMGAIVVVLAAVGSISHWRRNEVKALVVLAVATLLLTVFQPAIAVVNALPGLKSVRLPRSISFLDLALAVLAGVGLDAFVRFAHRRSLRRWAGSGFLAIGIITFVLWVAYPYNDRYRAGGLFWAGIGSMAGLVAVGAVALVVRIRQPARGPDAEPLLALAATDVLIPSDGASSAGATLGRPLAPAGEDRPEAAGGRDPIVRTTILWAAGLLLVMESLFLIMAGETTWSSSARPLTATPAERQLQVAVGSATVGFGQPLCFSAYLGIPINANILFGVHQLAVYDPMLPSVFYTSWKASTGRPAGYPAFSHYCPGFSTADEARQYGVEFVLENHGTRGPAGAQFDRTIGGQDLYRIPRAAFATLTPSGSGLPPSSASGIPVAVTHTTPRSLRVVTEASRPETLRLHLASVPGWRATIDGHPLALTTYSGVMLQAHLPSGRHVVVVSYWPKTFTLGIVLAGCSVIGLAVGGVVAFIHRRRVPAG